MDVGFTLVIKFGERGCARKCYEGYTREELVRFVTAKWGGMKEEEVYLSYDLLGVGEMDLGDEDDMSSMFRLLGESGHRRVFIFVRKLSGGSSANGCGETVVAGTEVGECSNVANAGASEIATMEGFMNQRRLSEEWRHLIVGPGQRFVGGALQFRKSLIKYSIEVGFEFVYLRNGPTRVTAVCRFRAERGCTWRISAVQDATDHALVITFYERTHSCGTAFGTVSRKRLNHHIVADLIIDDIRSMPTLCPGQIQALLKKNFGLDISYRVAWKSLEKGRNVVFGDHFSSFGKLPVYFHELLKANPGSHVNLDVGEDQKFRRCFVAFQACVMGFAYCRPMLMVDGTFLKGRLKGCLLSAVAKDGDEGLYPVAFAVVNEESDDNWAYFFHHLKLAIGDSREIVFVSDRNHGILNAVRVVFPRSSHAYCYNHLKSNLEYRCRALGKKARGIVLRYFQKCAYATSVQKFEEYADKLVKVGGTKAEAFLRDTPKEMWARAFFEGRRYGEMTSNACESWNSQIRDERLLPIVSMIDGIRIKLMQQMCARRQMVASWCTRLCKSIEVEINLKVEQCRSWDVRRATEVIFEVFSVPTTVVDLGKRECTCKMWQLDGVPCAHAVAVLFLKSHGDYGYVDKYFHTDAYKATYANGIVPFCIPETDGLGYVVKAPDFHQTRGRPKRRRIPSQGENIRRKIRCGMCGLLTHHNRKTCRMVRERQE